MYLEDDKSGLGGELLRSKEGGVLCKNGIWGSLFGRCREPRGVASVEGVWANG